MRIPASVGELTAGLLLLVLLLTARASAAESPHWWGEEVESRLADAGTNRVEIVRALEEAPAAQRQAVAFLVENMPAVDLASLSCAFLLDDVRQTYDRWQKTPWKDSVPNEIFLNDILAYACLNEAREAWRGKLRAICEPLVAGCKRPGDAALVLNQKLFPLLNVRYNTSRRRPDQSPSETMSTGVATCTGLSILLVDACRSVGVPARVAGTPMWSNMRGNHTWVEVWDGGWHFAGAAEPDAAGLDHGWFVGDAAQAKKNEPRHAIYASSFRRTGIAFPLVWARGDTSVNAENVTDRYAKAPRAEGAEARLDVKVIQADGKRVVADLTVTDPATPATVLTNQSRGETADLNDFASFKVAPGRKYHVLARLGELSAEADATPTKAEGELVTLTLGVTKSAAPAACPVPVSLAANQTHPEAPWKFPCAETNIAHYTAYRAAEPIKIDGRLDDAAWQEAPVSPRFVDILTGGPVIHNTRAAVVWDDQYLYVSYRVEEPFVHAKFTNHNDFIYNDNDVECFIAGPDAYYEFEINAFNTCYEAFFVWLDTYEKSGLSQWPEFARSKLVPFNGVDFTNHPRGGRLGNFNLALPGLKTAVHVDGTINNDADRDRGWTVELAFPWSSLRWLATDGRSLPPKDGDVWRMDFSRFNTYKEAPPAKDSGGWFWSPHGVWDSHIPECFPYITFSTKLPGHVTSVRP